MFTATTEQLRGLQSIVPQPLPHTIDESVRIPGSLDSILVLLCFFFLLGSLVALSPLFLSPIPDLCEVALFEVGDHSFQVLGQLASEGIPEILDKDFFCFIICALNRGPIRR